jgi:hypothetical protein
LYFSPGFVGQPTTNVITSTGGPTPSTTCLGSRVRIWIWIWIRILIYVSKCFPDAKCDPSRSRVLRPRVIFIADATRILFRDCSFGLGSPSRPKIASAGPKESAISFPSDSNSLFCHVSMHHLSQSTSFFQLKFNSRSPEKIPGVCFAQNLLLSCFECCIHVFDTLHIECRGSLDTYRTDQHPWIQSAGGWHERSRSGAKSSLPP